MPEIHATYGFAVEGLGPDSDSTKQYLMTSEPIGFSPSGFDVVPCLHDFPDSLTRSVGWGGGKVTQSTLDFRLSMYDKDPDVRVIMDYLSTERPRAIGVIVSPMTSSSGGVRFETLPGETAPVNGDYIYIEKEKLRLTADQSLLGDSNQNGYIDYYIPLDRGVHGTRGRSHSPDIKEYGLIFGSTPLVKGRRVVCYKIDHVAQSVDEAWTGMVERTDGEMGETVLAIKTRDSLIFGSTKSLGQSRSHMWARPWLRDDKIILNGVEPHSTFAKSTPLRVAGSNAPVIVYRIGEAIAACGVEIPPGQRTWQASGSQEVVERLFGNSDGMSRFNPDLADSVEAQMQNVKSILGWEVLTTRTGYNYWVDKDGFESKHICDVILGLLCSTGTMTWPSSGRVFGENSANPLTTPGSYNTYNFDCLPDGWGLGCDYSFIDYDSFYHLKTISPYRDLTLDNLVLGNDRELPKSGDVIDKILKSAGLALTIDVSGKIALRSMFLDDSKTITDVDWDTEVMKDTFRQIDSEWAPIGDIRITAATDFPGNESKENILHADITGFHQTLYEGYVEDEDIDAGFFGLPEGRMSPAQRGWLRVIFSQLYGLRNNPPPFYEMTLLANAPPQEVCDVFRISIPVARNGDGRGITDAMMLVVDSQLSLSNGSRHVKVANLSALGFDKQIAPCFPVHAGTGPTSITFQFSYVIAGDEGYLNNLSPLSKNLGELWDAYADDKAVELWSEDGQLRSAFPSLGYRAGVSVIMRNDNWGVTPVQGDVVRIAHWLDADITNRDIFAFIADQNGLLGSTAPADRWGI